MSQDWVSHAFSVEHFGSFRSIPFETNRPASGQSAEAIVGASVRIDWLRSGRQAEGVGFFSVLDR